MAENKLVHTPFITNYKFQKDTGPQSDVHLEATNVGYPISKCYWKFNVYEGT